MIILGLLGIVFGGLGLVIWSCNKVAKRGGLVGRMASRTARDAEQVLYASIAMIIVGIGGLFISAVCCGLALSTVGKYGAFGI